MSTIPATTLSLPQACHGMRDLADRYEAFILDIWGVIHDGQEAYPGVQECLYTLRNMGKQIVFLSNAPRRATRAMEGLERFGITPDMYDAVITSGEVTHQLLIDPEAEINEKFGYRYLFIGPERDSDLMHGTRFESAAAHQASFVLNVGFDDDDLHLASYIPILEEAARYQLPMICANPDKIIIRMDGSPFPCAGLLADAYAEMGGEVLAIGKPYPDVYRFAQDALEGLPADVVLAVGDNLDTDILGASQAGLDSALIAGGVLSHELSFPYGSLPSPQQLQASLRSAGTSPLFLLPTFTW